MTLFYIFKNLDFCKYADDSTLYSSGESLSIIIENLKANFLRIFKRYHETFMVLNPDKCHFMALGDPNYTCNLNAMVKQYNEARKF